MEWLVVKGARVNNLKNIEIKIPLNKITVITGVSGSGKSSLAIDVLYNEGQRRFIECLSPYVRQFINKAEKPNVDYIENLPPVIVIEAKNVITNSRSTVGSVTEIFDYLRLIYSKIGRIYDEKGNEIKIWTTKDVLDYLKSIEKDAFGFIGFKYKIIDENSLSTLESLGYIRIFVNNQIIKIDDLKNFFKDFKLKELITIIERFKVDNELDYSSLGLAIEEAFKMGSGLCIVGYNVKDYWFLKEFKNYVNLNNVPFKKLDTYLFDYNNPLGSCPTCQGFGSILKIDEDLVIPNKNLSVYNGAVKCWKNSIGSQWFIELIENADKVKFPIFKPYVELTENEKNLLWNGCKYFSGINDFFKYLESKKYKIQHAILLSKYRSRVLCPDCKGTRIRKETNYVKINGKTFSELSLMSLKELKEFLNNLVLNEVEKKIISQPLEEINKRLDFLKLVGLDYLNLSRSTNTLSGGELQRVYLAASIGNNLVGTLYILDEPSIGLHPKDIDNLIKIIKKLKNDGNTIIIVEHDKKIIKNADYIIDLGPMAGKYGGEVVFQGFITEFKNFKNKSLTAKYLYDEYPINNFFYFEKNISKEYNLNFSKKIIIKNAYLHNLKNLNVTFPLNKFSVIVGVSGSGKSTLMKDVLYSALKNFLDEDVKKNGCDAIIGDIADIKEVIFVDQEYIKTSSRSNLMTYLKIFDKIRMLFAQQPLAKNNNLKAKHFSLNTDGGRCENCKGEGYINIDMQFLADIRLLCEECNGKRYKKEILEVEYKGKNISDIFEMEVSEAYDFFSDKDSISTSLRKAFELLIEVGLGYLKLGQTTNLMSIGELQRLLLCSFLNRNDLKNTVLLFDEPSRGLHFYDILKLLKTFKILLNKGATIIVIEHNIDIIKEADYIVELGPEGGEKGGYLIFQGSIYEFLEKEIPNSNTKNFLLQRYCLNYVN